MDKTIYKAAKSGHLILTVNNRLARHFQQMYDLAQQKQGLSAWRRPDILSLSSWLSRCQKQVSGMPVFLNKAQLQHVWQSIIDDDNKRNGTALLHIPQTAQRAVKAHQMLVGHAAGFRAEQAADDHLAFLRWRQAWYKLSAEKGWHDPADLPWRIANAVDAGVVIVTKKVVLAGFDEIVPDLQNLVDTFRKAGTKVELWQPQPFETSKLSRLKADDPADEVGQCARWARRILEQCPAAKIAVVVPQLEAYQSLIERTFAAELEPESLLGSVDDPYTFNLSLGRSLDNEEVVLAALRLLRCSRQVEQGDIGWFLHTPYLGGAITERESRAKLERELIRLRRFSWPLSRLSKALTGLAEKFAVHAPGIINQFEQIATDLAAQNKSRLPGYWADHFARLLSKLGWPGERSLSSREYQAWQSFKAVLGELASLDPVAGPINRSEAVKLLARLVSATDFQTESHDAPVQILGELESAGLCFDHLWVLGLHDKALPRPPAPNPFIPLPVQRQHKMKRSDAEREHYFASQVTKRLFSAAPEVVLSWPAQEEGAPHRPSPFILAVEEGHPAMSRSVAPERLIWQSRPALETMIDDQAPPLATRKPFSGGTGILKDQALCPFRAFAHHRLRAEQVDMADIGIDNLSRGTLAHTVLEIFWASVCDQQTLFSLDEEELTKQIALAVHSALDRLERERRHDIPAKQRGIEENRLVNLTRRWLDVELRRSDFRIMAAEKGQTITIGNLSIKTRIDRIDELADGRCAIIDYKTGMPDPLQWLENRITEPQLPAYCLGMPAKRVGAVMFGVVRGKHKECGFRGLARDMASWPGAPSRKIDAVLKEKGWSDFDQVLAHWQSSLTDLGNAFAAGRAMVDPVDRDKACKYCDLSHLCRISERQVSCQGGEHG